MDFFWEFRRVSPRFVIGNYDFLYLVISTREMDFYHGV